MKYEAVILDLLGTLVPGLREDTYRASLEETALALRADPEEFIAHWTDNQVARERMAGSLLVPCSDAVETVMVLKDMGLKLALMCVSLRDAPRFWPDTPLAGLFDAAMFSCKVGLIKPDPRLYQLACERLGVRPERCLYVGDGDGDELSGAAAVGMDAVLICTPDEELLARISHR